MLKTYNNKVSAVLLSARIDLRIPHVVGRVHSKFQSGINFSFGNELIYVNAVGSTLSANGIQLTEDTFQCLHDNTEVGNLVVNKEGRFLIYTNGGVWEIVLSTANVVNLKIPTITCKVEEVRSTLLFKHLVALDMHNRLGLANDLITNEYLQQLRALRMDDEQSMSNLIRFFIGRGLGLTPAGDDLLYGYSLAKKTFAQGELWLRILGNIVQEDLTTAVSRSYITSLLDGYVSSQMLSLVKTFDSEDQQEVQKIVEKVMCYGHTSGYDTLQGFLIGLVSL